MTATRKISADGMMTYARSYQRSAYVLMKERKSLKVGFSDRPLCLLCWQAVENVLKAYLIHCDDDVGDNPHESLRRYSHRLRDLYNRVIELEPKVEVIDFDTDALPNRSEDYNQLKYWPAEPTFWIDAQNVYVFTQRVFENIIATGGGLHDDEHRRLTIPDWMKRQRNHDWIKIKSEEKFRQVVGETMF